MSQEAILQDDPEIHNEKKDLQNDQIRSQKPEQNKRKTLERQVTLCDEEVNMLQETSFINKEDDIQPSNNAAKESIEERELSDHTINTANRSHDLEENDLNEEKEDSKPKKCQCLFEVFECTLWAFRNIGRYISSRFRKYCCFCHENSDDIRKREIIDEVDDVGCWNVTENEDDQYNYNLNNDNVDGRKAIFHLNQGFDEGGKDISTDHCKYVKKSESETKVSNADVDVSIENNKGDRTRMSSTSAVCPVNVHHESHGNFSHSNDVNENHSSEPTSTGSVDCSSNNGGEQDFSGGDSGCDAGTCD